MFVTEARVKPVTAIGGPVVATAAALASPMRITGAFGTPVCVTAGSSWEAGIKSCPCQASVAFETAANAKPHYLAEVFASIVFTTAGFASPLILKVVFRSSAMFATVAYGKPVTANGGPVVTTAGVASTMHVTGTFGTPVCVTAGNG